MEGRQVTFSGACKRQVRLLVEGFNYLLWPRTCLICKEMISPQQGHLCKVCWESILFCSSGDYCPQCGLDASRYAILDQRCPQCLNRPFSFDSLFRCGVYDRTLKDAILAFKKDHTELRCVLGPMLNSVIMGCLGPESIDVFVPVPLHWTRGLSRGYNQAHVLARASQSSRGRTNQVLKRTRRTRIQPLAGSPGARQRNVAGAFKVIHTKVIYGKTVGLVDDVKTTGATLNECARVLKQAGARRVIAIVLAVAGQRRNG